VIGGADLMGQILSMADAEVKDFRAHYAATLQPHLSRMLVDATIVEIRRAAGEDVTTAATAVEASLANLALEQRELMRARAKAFALKAALALIARLIPPVI